MLINATSLNFLHFTNDEFNERKKRRKFNLIIDVILFFFVFAERMKLPTKVSKLFSGENLQFSEKHVVRIDNADEETEGKLGGPFLISFVLEISFL